MTLPAKHPVIRQHSSSRGLRGALPRRTSAALALFGASLPSAASAQGDVERPLPNVMLLVDTSGSMEFRAEDNALPQCSPGNPAGTNDKSRWIDLVEVMTGKLNQYSCFAMDRSSNAFRSEYSIGNEPPYDLNYLNPFHRIVSGGCVYGPGLLPASNPYEYPSRGVFRFPFTAPSTVTRGNVATQTDCTTWDQVQDGVLDVFREKVRFGLMTFDTHTDSGTGIAQSGGADIPGGMKGTWSYYLDDKPKTGKPAFCETAQSQEVGARNAAAPPWEGRMVAFGPPNATSVQLSQRNEQIQEILLATRPYGATPIAGQLHDAREFFWYDKTKDPMDQSVDFGPYSDPSVAATSCRRSLLILLSDGEPNLDLRPHCEQEEPGMAPELKGVCPYETPEDIVAQLLNPPPAIDPDRKVETVVIGFALDKVTPAGGTEITCGQLTETHCNDPANDSNRAVQACCTLNKIAAAGWDTPAGQPAKTAYFPQNGKELKDVFSQILKDVTVNLTTRTSAVFSSSGTTSDGGSHQFNSGFKPLVEEPWAGKLMRTRILCEAGVPKEQPSNPDQGDDFAANVNAGPSSRNFYTYVPGAGNAGRTLRANLSSDVDGVGALTGLQTAALNATNFVSAIPADVMEVSTSDCTGTSAAACRDAILGWTVGLGPNVDGETRCKSPGSDCNVFGAIYHSTPRLVSGRPNELLRDESYAAYARQQVTKQRPSVLYTATIDGQLHALRTAPISPDPKKEVNSKANNELWSFFPPAVLPVLRSMYPNTPATLLDGPIQTRDVVARTSNGKTLFERTQTDAIAGVGDWRTVLLSSFGHGQVGSGYYALDVSDPEISSGGPKFLWQMTTDATDKPLFGDGGSPLITTVFLKTSSLDPGREVAVAVLPGGDGGTRSGTGGSAGPLLETSDPDFASRNVVNAYVSSSLPARSVTIVRLDTGEVLRSFRVNAESNSIDSNRITVVDIPAPITGTPAAFPAAAGSVADRIFVGDREGRVWRIDVSKDQPSQWTMDVFFDAYFDLPGSEMAKRQPIELAPVVSVDEIGRITVIAATGEQRLQAAGSGMTNRVVSVTETLKDVLVGGNPTGDKKFVAQFNWVETLGCPSGSCQAGQTLGERVTGPMTLFGGSLYFATSSPAISSTAQCATGTNRVWGVDYKLNADLSKGVPEANADPLSGAVGALPIPVGQSVPPKTTGPSAGMVFGVAIEQRPSCSVEADTFDEDPYLGSYGNHTATTTITPGQFFLVYQVGGGSGGSETAVTTDKFELKPPRNSVWVDSWAPVFE